MIGPNLVSALIAWAFCAPQGSTAQPGPPAAPDRAQVVKAAREVMVKARFATLVTLGRDGHPQARVVDPFAPEEDLTVWMATNPRTRKVEEIGTDSRVTLLYLDVPTQSYVTLLGRAEAVRDAAEKAKRWKEEWSSFYAEKNRGEDYLLFRVRPHRIEVVSEPHGLRNDPRTWRPVVLDLPQGPR
jgi:general stress protein 26